MLSIDFSSTKMTKLSIYNLISAWTLASHIHAWNSNIYWRRLQRCWWRMLETNTLATTLRCWWRIWPFLSPTSPTFQHPKIVIQNCHQDNGTNIYMSPTSMWQLAQAIKSLFNILEIYLAINLSSDQFMTNYFKNCLLLSTEWTLLLNESQSNRLFGAESV